MHPFVTGIQTLYKRHSDPERAIPMKAYMRNQFDFIGINATLRRDLGRGYMKRMPMPPAADYPEVVRQLWALPERDFQYFAIEFAMKYKKWWGPGDIVLFEEMITAKSWWDTVDYITSKLVGPWFRSHPGKMGPITGRWNRSDNFWLQRVSLIFQLTYKDATDKDLLGRYILRLSESDEFFVQKAAGWALRQYSKHNPEWVTAFVQSHMLKPLTRREALKVVSRE